MERLYNEIKTTISFVCDGRNCRLETAQDIHNRVMNRLNDWGKFLESKKKSIVECLIHQIEQDDVILTFGESERITEALVGAALQKPFRQFRVVVVGGRPKQNNENMLHENDAARILCDLCKNEGMKESEVKEGKIELSAEYDGLLKIDKEKLFTVNSFGQMMIATRYGNTPVKVGDKLAGTRIIPLVIEKDKMQEVKDRVCDDRGIGRADPLFRTCHAQ